MSIVRDEAQRVLETVPLLAGVNEHGLRALLDECELGHFAPGARALVELEPGDHVLVLLRGRGEVTVGGYGGGAPARIAEVGPGDVLGEVTALTGELRSATVTAIEPMDALVVSGSVFERLLARFPCVAEHCYRLLAARLRETEALIGKILDPQASPDDRRTALQTAPASGGQARRIPFLHAVVRGYRELVKGHGCDLAFLMLVSFAGSLLAVRGGIHFARVEGAPLDVVLKGTYIVGLMDLCVSILFALNVHRPIALRFLALFFGAGMALLLNGMSALIAFDIFYRHDWSPDPRFPFTIETLYDRSEGPVLLLAAAALLVQAAFLRKFYLRVIYQVLARLQGARKSGR